MSRALRGLKTGAAFLVKLPNSPITRTGSPLMASEMGIDAAIAPSHEGYVYILKNAAMPDYIKIGLTQQDDLNSRLKQLDNTSTPLPFECYYAARVPDCRKLERALHFIFGEKRTRINREFFTADPDTVKAVIELVAIQETQPTDADQAITPAQRDAIEETKSARQGRVSLFDLGLKVGEELTFVKDPAVVCQVAGAKTVIFRGEELSASQAALKAVREMGYEWTSISGFEYWARDGVKLAGLKAAAAALSVSG